MSSSIQHQTEKFNLLDYLDEGKLTDLLSIYGKNIAYALVALIALLAITYRFSSGQTIQAEQQYIQAANDFSLFAKPIEDPALTGAALDRLTAIMAKHPELHAAYDGAIAQTLLNRGQVDDALPYAKATLSRTESDGLSFYRGFAQTSLLISKEQYKEALAQAQTLQQQMLEIAAVQPADGRAFSDELFALNLLRIALLQQEVGDKAAELQSWKTWKEYAGLGSSKMTDGKIRQEAFRMVMQQLTVGSVAIPDYIAYREKFL